MSLARFIVAAWCSGTQDPLDRAAVMKYCSSLLAQLRGLRHHDLAHEIREVMKKGKERYLRDAARDLAKQ